MISTQVNNVLCPKAYLINKHRVKGLHPLPPLPPVSFVRCPPLKFHAPLKITTNVLRCKQSMPVCLSGGEARAGNGNEEPLWKSFGKAIENLGKKPSVEDVLKQQIEKRDYYDGGNPPGGGGGSSGGGGFGDLGGSEEEDSLLHETIQVFLATVGFILIYLYIINGAELMILARDFIKFVFRGKKSIRLARTFHMWKTIFKNLTEKPEKVKDDSWLRRAIITTPTWWDSPEKYRLMLKAYLQKKYGQSNDNQYDQDDVSQVSNL